ncbi:MAG: AraC family transcriptional regulator [Acetobacter sp.]|uniref:helix-turn-helix transcriptional regulator n=1 Tax=Acetobacter sp. TaxID=440 RepID=UPI0039E93421
MVKTPPETARGYDPGDTISAQSVYTGSDAAEALPAVVTINAHTQLIALNIGIRILYWQSATEKDFRYSVRHDDDLIYFGAYTDGSARLEARCHDGLASYDTQGGCDDAYVAYRPGCLIDFTKTAGAGSGVTVAISPSMLAELSAEDATVLDRRLRSGHCFNQIRGSRDLLGLAGSLRAARTRTTPGTQLQMLGGSLSFMGLLVEQIFGPDETPTRLSRAESRRLQNVRDFLFADLAAPPRLDLLARQAGMSVSRLQRGFRLLFGSSVYALFQKERMDEARRLLLADDQSILSIATALGYTNPGHFSAAFRKQFGINPSELRRTARFRR